MPDVESRKSDHSLISSGSGWLYIPKAVCGQLKERVNHHMIHNAYVSDVSRVGKSSSLKGVIQTLLYMMPKKVTPLGCLP